MKRILQKSATLILLSALATTGFATTLSYAPDADASSYAMAKADGTETAIPYSVDFTEKGMADWTAIDANKSGTTWSADEAIQLPGYDDKKNIPYMGSEASYDISANDYFVSPAFKLKAGQTYAATFDVYCYYGRDDFGGLLTLMVGTSKDDESTFKPVTDMTLASKSDVIANEKHTFAVEKDGTYYIAVRTTGCEIAENCVYEGFTGMKLEETDEAPETVIAGGGDTPDVEEALDLPYEVSFSTEPADWKIVDKSVTAGTTWKYSQYMRPGHDAANGMGIQGDYGGGPDDYLISPLMKFEAGKTYTVTASYTTYQTGGDLSIELGTDANDVSTFSVIGTAKKNGNSYFENDEFDFTVPENGNYNIAFHVTSKSNYAYTYVFDCSVKEKGTNAIKGIENIPAEGAVTVYTIDGRLASTTADMTGLNNGTYIVTVKAADGSVKSFKVAK